MGVWGFGWWMSGCVDEVIGTVEGVVGGCCGGVSAVMVAIAVDNFWLWDLGGASKM